MRSPILWQDSEKTVTLLDIPHSIASAQESRDEPFRLQLHSPSAPLTPYTTNEPKSAAAKTKLASNSVDADLHAEYQQLLLQAVKQIQCNHDGLWCLRRTSNAEALRTTKKRKMGTNTDDALDHRSIHAADSSNEPPQELFHGGAHSTSDGSFKVVSDMTCLDTVETAHGKASAAHFFYNDQNNGVFLQFDSTVDEQSYKFRIPPKASCYIGDCANSRDFNAAVRNQAQHLETRKHFDFILLDPPWPNRSVKRTHKTPGSTYSTSPSLTDIRGLVFDTDLDLLMDDDCLVGIWTTNKPAVRDLVLGEDGLFACWGVKIVEEWLWLKTTVHREPVTPLDALWRKPYEVLLLGRKRRRPTSEAQNTVSASVGMNPAVKRRVIVGVPAHHSMKPCLKELIEPLMPNRNDYRALEVFARHLVAGWWSWGDECIKFNWTGYWRESVHDAAEQETSP